MTPPASPISFDDQQPGSNRSSIVDELPDVTDRNGVVAGLKSRQRNFSGGNNGLDLEPLPDRFTQEELGQFLQYFVDKKIRKSKIQQHLQGSQLYRGAQVRNYPGIDAKAVDTEWTALHWSCYHGHLDLVQGLTAYCKANAQLTNAKGSSPIHLAISQGHKRVVEKLVEYDSSLVRSVNTFTGWYPLHTAAYFTDAECAAILLRNGGRANQLTDENSYVADRFTVFHLAASLKSKQMATIQRNPGIIHRQISKIYDECQSTGDGGEDDNDDPDTRTEDTLDLLLEYLPEERMEVVMDSKLGTVLHYFAALNYARGIEKIVNAPYLHPPDVTNKDWVSPLSVSLEHRSLQAALQLLQHDVDVERVHRKMNEQTPLQLLLNGASSMTETHLAIVDLMLEKGADPTHTSTDTVDSPVYIATNATLDVRLMEKFLVHLDDKNMNLKDQYTGDTLLHFAVVNCESETIVKILQKGADVMLNNATACSEDGEEERKVSPEKPVKLPIEVAINSNRGKVYFEALEKFGIHDIVNCYSAKNERCKIVDFIQTHLCGSAKEINLTFFKEIYKFASSVSRDIFEPDPHELDRIIHYREDTEGSIFCKTALNWANENNNKIISLELLKLEMEVHKSKVIGLECLRSNLSSDALLPWIIDTYQNFFEKDPTIRWFMAIFTVFVELVLLSYLPFLYDFYSDIVLGLNYQSIAYDDDTFHKQSLWNCTENLNSTCFEQNGTDNIRDMFEKAFWITVVSVIVSLVFYLVCVVLHSNPRFICQLEKQYIDYCTKKNMNKTFAKVSSWIIKYSLITVCKLGWPVLHIVRKIRYNASTKKSEFKDLTTESDERWNMIKTAEYGIESSIQLFLQLWLLKPFFSDITRWSTEELVIKSINGISNFVTFNIYKACYIERALGKILLTGISLSFGVALMKSTKPGMSACETPLRMLPILTSIIAQVLGRIYALRSLIVINSSIGYYKYIVFFSTHIFLVFLFKILFETKSKKTAAEKKQQQQKLAPLCTSRVFVKARWLNMLRFVISGISSGIVMVHMHEETQAHRKRHHSLIAHCLFFLLILVENLVLGLLPILAPSHYPDTACFAEASHTRAIWLIVGAWIIGVLFQIIHYKWAHPWAALNGLRNEDSAWIFLTKCCWQQNIQKVSIQSNPPRFYIENTEMTNLFLSNRWSRDMLDDTRVSNQNLLLAPADGEKSLIISYNQEE